MAQQVHLFPVTVPAGVPRSAPLVFNLPMPPSVVESIRVRIPPGPRGEVGFAVGAAGVAVMPVEPGAFIVADNEAIEWLLTDQITSGAWQALAYNTGIYAHTLYVSFMVRATTATAEAGAIFAPIPSDVLAG